MKTYVLNEDQEMIKELADTLVKAEIAPRSAAVDQEALFPSEGLELLAGSGLSACMTPEAYEGPEMDYWSQIYVTEETAKACASTALVLANTADVAECIIRHGSESMKQTVLPEIIEGAAAVAAASDCPPNTPELLSLLAVKDENGFVLNGRKRNVPGAESSAWLIVQAAGENGSSCFVIGHDTPGITFTVTAPKLGFKGVPLYDVEFHDVHVSADALLSDGAQVTLCNARSLSMAAIAVGIAEGAIDECVAYVNQRVQFGKRISEFENTQAVMTEMIAQTEACRAQLWNAAAVKDAGEDYRGAAFLCKLTASSNAAVVTRKVIQFMGGYGYSREYPVERKMRDAKMTELLGNANEILKFSLAKHLIVQ